MQTPLGVHAYLVCFFRHWRHCSLMLIGVFVLINPSSLFAQDIGRYERIFPEGQLPRDFLLSSTEKSTLAAEEIQAKDTKVLRKAKEAFYEESYYYINQLLLSGKVLFNDPVSEYVSKVGGYLLRDHPELQAKIRFYAVRSPAVNAFATNNGLILVNMGLLAQVEDEAQLAFILAHEISHFRKEHPLDIFLNARELQKGSGRIFGSRSFEDVILAKNNYSKEKEQEADLLGLELFRGSEYDLSSTLTAFEVLKYSHLPFGNLPFDKSFFETQHLKLPDEYFLDSLKAISENYDDFDTEKSTHPSPDARKQILMEEIKDDPKEGRKKWIIGKDEFLKIQRLCRFETCYLHLYNQRYETAIYHSYLLSKKFPENKYLKKVIAQSLYGLSKYANAGKLWDVHVDFDEIEGQQQQINHFIEKANVGELNVLAMVYNWNLYRAYPEDTEVKLMSVDLMKELSIHHIKSLSYFADTLPSSLSDIASDTVDFLPYALVDLMQDSVFVSTMEESFLQAKLSEKKTTSGDDESQKNRHKKNRQVALQGFNLGLEKVVFVDPFYQRIDGRKTNRIQFRDSESTEKKFISLLGEYSDEVDLKYEMLSTRQLENGDISTFKDLILLNEWIQEKMSYDGLSMISINHSEVQYLREKYGTEFFVWTGAMSLTQTRSGKGLMVSAGLLFWPMLPYSLYYSLTPDHDTFLYTMVYDLERGEYLILYPKLIKMKDKQDVLNSVAYDLVYQLKSER